MHRPKFVGRLLLAAIGEVELHSSYLWEFLPVVRAFSRMQQLPNVHSIYMQLNIYLIVYYGISCGP